MLGSGIGTSMDSACPMEVGPMKNTPSIEEEKSGDNSTPGPEPKPEPEPANSVGLGVA